MNLKKSLIFPNYLFLLSEMDELSICFIFFTSPKSFLGRDFMNFNTYHMDIFHPWIISVCTIQLTEHYLFILKHYLCTTKTGTHSMFEHTGCTHTAPGTSRVNRSGSLASLCVCTSEQFVAAS